MQEDYEDLIADMLDINNEDCKDRQLLFNTFYKKYNIDMDTAYHLVCDLLKHTPQVQAGLSKKNYHAFVSKSAPVMLMKTEATIEH